MFCVGILRLSRRGYLRESDRNPEIVRLSRHGGGHAVVRETKSLVITKIGDFRTTSVGCTNRPNGQKVPTLTRFTSGLKAGILLLNQDNAYRNFGPTTT